jgi:hypothetical protein
MISQMRNSGRDRFVAQGSSMTRTSITVLLSAFLFVACSGGSGSDENDASIAVSDADPNAPDADPNAPDGATARDAGSSPDGSVGSVSDAGATAGISCGMDVCNENTEDCCFVGGGGGGSATCVASGTCEGTPSTCDGPEDCGGDICCGSFAGASCSATCEGQAAELCHTEADCQTTGDMCCDFGPLSICAASCGGGMVN